jgi:hypothetical protein
LGFDGTGKDGKDLVTFNITTRNTKTNETRTLCLRGAFLVDNKTAEAETRAIKDRCILHGQSLLETWIATHLKMFPTEADTHTIPKPTTLRPARAAAGSVVMSDGCNQAQKMQKLVAELVIEDYKTQVGPAVWDSMTA